MIKILIITLGYRCRGEALTLVDIEAIFDLILLNCVILINIYVDKGSIINHLRFQLTIIFFATRSRIIM
jgi:hypothetical protein